MLRRGDTVLVVRRVPMFPGATPVVEIETHAVLWETKRGTVMTSLRRALLPSDEGITWARIENENALRTTLALGAQA